MDLGLVDDRGGGDWGVRSVDVEKTKQVSGKLIAVGDKENTYFTPQLSFANLVNDDWKPREFYEVIKNEFVENLLDGSTKTLKAAIVCWRVIGCGVFQNSFDMRSFPFDQQLLSIQLLSDWDVKDVRLVRNMKTAYSSLVQKDAFVPKHEYEMSRMLHMMPVKSNPKARGQKGHAR